MADGKTYTLGDFELVMREKASFIQVQKAIKLIGDVDVSKTTDFGAIVSKLAEAGTALMTDVIFYHCKPAQEINWDDVDFDQIVQMIEDFLSSSSVLSKLLEKFKDIFLRVEQALETIHSLASIGANSDGSDLMPKSIKRPEATITPPKD